MFCCCMLSVWCLIHECVLLQTTSNNKYYSCCFQYEFISFIGLCDNTQLKHKIQKIQKKVIINENIEERTVNK